MLIYAAPVCALLGLIVYAASPNGKAVEIGRIMFFAGLFAWLMNAR